MNENFAHFALKYILEGTAVAIVAYVGPLLLKGGIKKPQLNEAVGIAIGAGLILFILDTFSKDTAQGTRFGVGANIGGSLIKHNEAKLSV